MKLSESVGFLLHRCSDLKALRAGLSLHAAVLKTGMQSHTVVANHVINMYAKCGRINSAHQVFDEMRERNLVSWAALISGYDQSHEPLVAIQLYSRMPLAPNEFVLASVISACASVGSLVHGQRAHARALKLGYAPISFVSNALISLYMKCGLCDSALAVFGCSTLVPNSISHNTLLAGFVENGQPLRGLEVFESMCRHGFIPDRFSFAGALGACTDAVNLQGGLQLHCQTMKLKLDSTAFVGNTIMTMYSKFDLIEQVEKVFMEIEEKDIISWNTLIAGCSQCDNYLKGLSFFKGLLAENAISPDDFTFSGVLSACAGIASICHGKQIHAYLIRTRLRLDVGVENSLVNMYSKCGCIGYAYVVFSRTSHRSLVTWNSIIAGFGNHGLGRNALDLFEQMKESGVKPDSVTFVALLVACSHSGLTNRGQSLFDSMAEVYGISPSVEHFSCLVDMLGRAGRLQEVGRYMKRFPFGNDRIVLGSLLSACRLQGGVSVGEWLGEQLLKLLQTSTSPFVLLSNLYASDRMWSSAAEIRRMLKGSGLKKEPGHSLIEVKGILEKFTIGDFSHSQIEEIKDVLRTLNWAASELST